eukprot:GEMP01002608.1.p1 GENE.GEMP01002608.1~~GEMP01002608.1.p1  ORF type:complete len:1223 (+),score=282.44 GEMP01002608.1:169-3837(+)
MKALSPSENFRKRPRQKVSMLEPISEPSEWMEVSLKVTQKDEEDEFECLWVDFEEQTRRMTENGLLPVHKNPDAQQVPVVPPPSEQQQKGRVGEQPVRLSPPQKVRVGQPPVLSPTPQKVSVGQLPARRTNSHEIYEQIVKAAALANAQRPSNRRTLSAHPTPRTGNNRENAVPFNSSAGKYAMPGTEARPMPRTEKRAKTTENQPAQQFATAPRSKSMGPLHLSLDLREDRKGDKEPMLMQSLSFERRGSFDLQNRSNTPQSASTAQTYARLSQKQTTPRPGSVGATNVKSKVMTLPTETPRRSYAVKEPGYAEQHRAKIQHKAKELSQMTLQQVRDTIRSSAHTLDGKSGTLKRTMLTRSTSLTSSKDGAVQHVIAELREQELIRSRSKDSVPGNDNAVPRQVCRKASKKGKKKRTGFRVLDVVTTVHPYNPTGTPWPFTEQSHPRLPLDLGQVVDVISEDDNGWSFGINATNRRGYFPTSFVVPVSKAAQMQKDLNGEDAQNSSFASTPERFPSRDSPNFLPATRQLSDSTDRTTSISTPAKNSSKRGTRTSKPLSIASPISVVSSENATNFNTVVEISQLTASFQSPKSEDSAVEHGPGGHGVNAQSTKNDENEDDGVMESVFHLESLGRVLVKRTSSGSTNRSGESMGGVRNEDMKSVSKSGSKKSVSLAQSPHPDSEEDFELFVSPKTIGHDNFVDAVEQCNQSWNSAESEASDGQSVLSKASPRIAEGDTLADTQHSMQSSAQLGVHSKSLSPVSEDNVEFFIDIDPEAQMRPPEFAPEEVRQRLTKMKDSVPSTTFRIMSKTDTFEEALRLKDKKDKETANENLKDIAESSESNINVNNNNNQNDLKTCPGVDSNSVALGNLRQAYTSKAPCDPNGKEARVENADKPSSSRDSPQDNGDLQDTWAQIEIQTEILQMEAATRQVGKIDPSPPKIMNYTEAKKLICEMELDNQILEDLTNTIAPKRGLFPCLYRPRSLRIIPRLSKARQPESDRIHCLIRQHYDSSDMLHQRMIHAIFQKLTGNKHPPLLCGYHWEDVGFQGNDPATDLNRFGGIFNLLVMLRLIEKAPKLVQKMVALSRHDVQHFPLMCTSINFTKLTLDKFRAGEFSSLKGDLIDVLADVQNAMMSRFMKRTMSEHRSIGDFSKTFKEVEYLARTPNKLLRAFHAVVDATENPTANVTSKSNTPFYSSIFNTTKKNAPKTPSVVDARQQRYVVD